MKVIEGARFDKLLLLLNHGTRKLLPHGSSQFKVTLFTIQSKSEPQRITIKITRNMRPHQGFAEPMRMTTSVTSTGTKAKTQGAAPVPGLQNTKCK